MPLSEHFTDDTFIYLVRPFYNRGNVLRAMKEKGINLLAERELKSGAKTVLKALNSIHRAGYLHGNVRPQSIFQDKFDGEDRGLIVLGKYEFCCPIDMWVEQPPYFEKSLARLLYLAPEAIES